MTPHDGTSHQNCKHDHAHGHRHGHGHHHHHAAPGRVGTAFALNLGFAVIELVGGILTNSMAILSDALHDFGDSLALGMAWWLEKKSRQKSDAFYTYGYRRFSVFSAFVTGVILAVGSIWIVIASVPRLFNPEPVNATGMLGLAFFGIVVNGIAFYRLSKGSSLNERMLSWHFIEDLTGWVLVLVGSVIMLLGDWPWIDPLMALLLSGWVLWNVVKHLKQTLVVFLQASPEHLQTGEAQNWMQTLAGVEDVHHTHVWSLDGEAHILTTHIVVNASVTWAQAETLKQEIKKGLREKFQIAEVTIEFEQAGNLCFDPTHVTSST
ncbi:MAG: cation diffusion facilitator family transporter [Bdellovibrio sp.]|jgi:cobalt-zinc-cadmium efflux system protein